MEMPEELLIKIINTLAEKLKNNIVLKGGMLLRLYGCPRSTQDVDFVLTTTQSRKIWKPLIEEALELLNLTTERFELNSRGIFIDVFDGKVRAQIEISVLKSTEMPPEPLSTVRLSEKYSLGARIVSTMAIPEAFSHKIAASIERDVLRDLFDISQFETMGTFDEDTLKKRFSKISIGRAKPISLTFKDAAKKLKSKSEALTQDRIEIELYPLLPREYQTGLLVMIKASVGRLIQKLEVIKN